MEVGPGEDPTPVKGEDRVGGEDPLPVSCRVQETGIEGWKKGNEEGSAGSTVTGMVTGEVKRKWGDSK